MRDFASFLDWAPDPTVKAVPGEAPVDDSATVPSIPFGFVAGEEAGSGAAGQPEFVATAYLGLNAERMADELPPETAPDAIARELSLHRAKDMKSLGRMRREFAFRNHPDRVRPEWRDAAMTRMQIANRMIDEARQRLADKRA